MRPRAILVASVVGVAVLPVATAASGSDRAGSQGREARAATLYRAPAQAAQKKLKKPCKRCKNLNVPQGSGVLATCGPPELVDERVTAASQVLELVTDQTGVGRTRIFGYNTVAGDLLFAAIVTDGATITPPAGWQAVPGGGKLHWVESPPSQAPPHSSPAPAHGARVPCGAPTPYQMIAS